MEEEINPKRKVPRITPDEVSPVSQKIASLSVSELSEYYYYNCEKFLKLKSRKTLDEKSTQSTKGPTLKTSEMQRGRKYEVEVENELRNSYGDNIIKCENVSNDANIKLLREAKVGQIFCQMSFKVNEAFYEKFNLKGIIEIKDFRPDFIKVIKKNNEKAYQILDAKSSKDVQYSHKIQVALYAYLLNLTVQGINISTECGIYLPQFDLLIFDINDLLPEIKVLFRERLPRIIKTSIQNLPWHFDSSCENCYFVYSCRKEVKEENEMNDELSNGADIEDLVKYLANTGADDERAKGVKKVINYDEKLKSSPYMKMKSGQAQFVGIATTDFPQDHNLLITMSLDTLSLKPFGWGICLYARDKKIKRDSKSFSINEASNEEAYFSLMDKFTTLLEECFEYLNSNNLRSCVFVYSKKEKEYIQDSLINIINIENPQSDLDQIKRKARRCLFNLFEDPKLLSVIKDHEELPAYNTREFPKLVILEQTIRENVAICVPGFYQLKDIWEELVMPKLRNKALVNFLKSHIKDIDLDSIFTLWNSWNSAVPEHVNEHHLLRVDFGYEVIKAYYELLKESAFDKIDKIASKLVFDAPLFTFTSTKTFRNHYLGKLYYFKLLEAKAECKQLKSQRMSDYLQNQSTYGIQIQFEKIIKNSEFLSLFTILSNEQELKSIPHSKGFMLVEDSLEGILEAIRFPDMKHMDSIDVYYEPNSTILGNREIDLQNQKVYLTGTVKINLYKDNIYRLYKRCIDFNTNNILEMLIEIDNRGDKSVFMDLLINTNDWCPNPITLKGGQRKEELLEERLQILSQPIRSSKISSLISGYLNKPIGTNINNNYIIGLTANSRDSIENLLKRISELKHVKIFSMVNVSNNKYLNEGVIECEASTLPAIINKIGIPGKPIVIGGTIWDWYKLRAAWNGRTRCDIMIIDQGSKAISDASIAIECLKPKVGKLIISGDSELKPFIRNKYPTNYPYLFGSIQECLNSLIKD
ncbi:16491_t:CDS:10 [Funneliformis geosporum]|nr:16491_t:CDS:10 [Funneliformis geosporum]